MVFRQKVNARNVTHRNSIGLLPHPQPRRFPHTAFPINTWPHRRRRKSSTSDQCTCERRACSTCPSRVHRKLLRNMQEKLQPSSRSERQGKPQLLENLRSTMDLHGYYADETIEMAADAQARDIQRLTNQVERKRREKKAALEKRAGTTKLSRENWISKGQLDSMTLNAEYAKTTAFHRERQLRKEVKQIADSATTDTVSIHSYRREIAKIHRLKVALELTHLHMRDGRPSIGNSLWQNLFEVERPDKPSTLFIRPSP